MVGHTDAAAGEAMQLHSLTDRIRLLTNSEVDAISPVYRRRLDGAGISVLHDHIAGAVGSDGRLAAIVTRGGVGVSVAILDTESGGLSDPSR